MEYHKIKTVLIASGGGTDANAIMQAHCAGFLSNIEIMALISTKEGAGCLEKAISRDIPAIVIDRETLGYEGFHRSLLKTVRDLDCQLIFLVGCIVKVPTILNVKMYNIHPADPFEFGGKRMYGLEVHKRVIAHIEDLIKREKKNSSDRFFTYPTVHEVGDVYDSGQILLQASIEIPNQIIIDKVKGRLTPEEAAAELQKHVLRYEHDMLPTAVKMAARMLNNLNGFSYK